MWLYFRNSSFLVFATDCKFCVQVIHRLGSAAEISSHPGVYGAQQSGPVPEGGAGDHYRPAHASSSRVCTAAVPQGPSSVLVGCASDIKHHHLTITKLTDWMFYASVSLGIVLLSVCSGRIRTFRLTLSQWLMRSSWKPPRTRDGYKQKHTTHIFSWCPFLLVNCTKGTLYDEQNFGGKMILQAAGYIGFIFGHRIRLCRLFNNHFW